MNTDTLNDGVTKPHERISLLETTPEGLDQDQQQTLEDRTDTGTRRMSRRSIIKNLLILSVAFLFLFTAFQSLQNLQSSLNKEEGLGTTSLSIIYVTGMLAGLCLPPLAIKRLGCKWTIAGSMVCYVVFMAANLYAVWGTMIPAAIIIGIGSAPLWAAKCTYLTQLGVWYAELTNTTTDGAISVFFGVFFMFFQSSQIWGNLISSVVFSQQVPDQLNVSGAVLSRCGASYCPEDYTNNTYLDRPDMTKVYTVCGIYLASACIAVMIIVLFLDKLVQDTDEESRTTRQLVTAIVHHFYSSRYQQLLVPLTVYSGMEQAFVAGEFTRSFISCSIGVWNIGYIMIVYGVVDAVSSLIIGRLVKFTGFIPWFTAVFVVHGGCQVVFLLWAPSDSHTWLFFVLAACWGFGDAIMQTLLNGFYGYIFTDKPETAFGSYRLLESAGFIVAFGYSNSVCTDVKIFVCLFLLVIGLSLYGIVEVLNRRQKRNEINVTKSETRS